MVLRVYNDLTRRKEEFQPLDPPKVKMYVCGITPYDETHLGHGRAYVTFDLVRRWLEFSGYKVTYVQNITDVDDKIIQKSKVKNQSYGAISEFYTNSYFEVMDRLNVRRADRYPKATEHIAEMVRWIGGLVERGYAYLLDDGVYFEVNKFADYGKLSGRKKEEQEAGARVEVDNRKKNPLDFALWKKAKQGEPSWPSPWGEGRPGWHIECSVMSTKYLGEQFDIHGGGMDLEFPHHENEIAQTESYTGKPWVKYWLHNGFVNVNKQKMSKSLGNFFTLKDIFDKYDPMVVRFFLLSTHYRSPIDFSDELLNSAASAYERINMCRFTIADAIYRIKEKGIRGIENGTEEIVNYQNKFIEAMDDDFNTAKALGVIFEFVRFINERHNKFDLETLSKAQEFLSNNCHEILGIRTKLVKYLEDDPAFESLIKEREDARKRKDFKRADEIRRELAAQGIVLEDTAYGTKWKAQA